jgi:hypothetical protein
MILAADVPAVALAIAPIGGIFNLSDCADPSFAEIEAVLAENFKVRIKKMPLVIARLIAYVGDVVNCVAQKRVSPLDSRSYRKITDSFTLDVSRLSNTICWKPTRVLEFIKNNIR